MRKFSQILLLSAFAFCAATAGTVAATAPQPIPAPPSALPPPAITLAEARAIIDGAIAYARQHNAAMAVMIVDTAGNPIASERMDGVSLTYLQFAEGKAFASAMLRQTSEELSHLAKDRPDRYFGIIPARCIWLAGASR